MVMEDETSHNHLKIEHDGAHMKTNMPTMLSQHHLTSRSMSGSHSMQVISVSGTFAPKTLGPCHGSFTLLIPRYKRKLEHKHSWRGMSLG